MALVFVLGKNWVGHDLNHVSKFMEIKISAVNYMHAQENFTFI